MRIPRDVSGRSLAKTLAQLGYVVDHERGSHMRLVTTVNGSHAITVPDHRSLKIGTLNAILADIALHHDLAKDALVEMLFG